jgi:formamidopyrimidine-DNA glycosylase
VPELPDISIYVDAVAERTVGHAFEKLRLASPFFLRSFAPPAKDFEGARVVAVRRLGKRIVIELEGQRYFVIHLMVAGRFRWADRGAKIPGKLGQAALDFDSGTLLVTEASSKKRASLHLVAGDSALADFDRGGLEVLSASREDFVRAMTEEVHTLKRSLTDPRILSGIGNAYSDEILFEARLGPLKLTSALTDDEWTRLYEAIRTVLVGWTDRLKQDYAGVFPEGVTAFREGMAVHGRYGKPCPRCGQRVQRITYADNETNYCATCQTGGKLLADRSLSRLLGKDWPKTLEELEERRPAAKLAPNPARSTRVPKKKAEPKPKAPDQPGRGTR